MPDDARDKSENLRPADYEDLKHALSFALRFDKRRRLHRADELMASITAQHLIEHLEASGYVVMQKPPARAPSTSPHMGKHKEG